MNVRCVAQQCGGVRQLQQTRRPSATSGYAPATAIAVPAAIAAARAAPRASARGSAMLAIAAPAAAKKQQLREQRRARVVPDGIPNTIR